MLTWKLWRALTRPPLISPLFKRAYTQRGGSGLPWIPPVRFPLMDLLRNTGLIILPIILILFGAPILVLLYYVSLILAPLLLPAANTVFGLIHANGASGSIARERDRQTYDVLCASPTGSLGLHWSYCIGWLHYHWLMRTALIGVLSIGIVASVLGLSGRMFFGSGTAPLPVTLVRGVTLGLIFFLDYLQTPVLSSLTTLLVPIYSENEGKARLWASSVFLVIQMAVYLPTFLIAIYALPNTLSLLGVDPLLIDVLVPLAVLAFFTVLREIIIVGLWSRVKQELSASTVELDAVTRLAV
jgi:hypothetical protein